MTNCKECGQEFTNEHRGASGKHELMSSCISALQARLAAETARADKAEQLAASRLDSIECGKAEFDVAQEQMRALRSILQAVWDNGDIPLNIGRRIQRALAFTATGAPVVGLPTREAFRVEYRALLHLQHLEGKAEDPDNDADLLYEALYEAKAQIERALAAAAPATRQQSLDNGNDEQEQPDENWIGGERPDFLGSKQAPSQDWKPGLNATSATPAATVPCKCPCHEMHAEGMHILPRNLYPSPCPDCQGTGQVPVATVPCDECFGKGKLYRDHSFGSSYVGQCHVCGGTGKVPAASKEE